MNKWTIIGAALAVLLVIVVMLWFVWKVYFRLFKHFVIALLIGLVGAGIYYYRSLPPPRDPSLGKHAYLTANGKYLGVVEGQGEDNRRGPVWIVRQPGGYPVIYAKARVTLKEKLELPPDDENQPASPAPTPAAKSQPKKK